MYVSLSVSRSSIEGGRDRDTGTPRSRGEVLYGDVVRNMLPILRQAFIEYVKPISPITQAVNGQI